MLKICKVQSLTLKFFIKRRKEKKIKKKDTHVLLPSRPQTQHYPGLSPHLFHLQTSIHVLFKRIKSLRKNKLKQNNLVQSFTVIPSAILHCHSSSNVHT